MKVFTEKQYESLNAKISKEWALKATKMAELACDAEHRQMLTREHRVLDLVLPKLKTLENNTWDKNLVEEIRRILFMNLGA